MQHTPRPLLILHPDPVVQERVKRAARDRFDTRQVESWEELRKGVAEAPPAAVVVVDPYFGAPERRRTRLPDNGDGPSQNLRELLVSYPSATVVAGMDSTPTRHRDLWSLGEWGIAEILQTDEDTSLLAVRRRLLSARAQPLRRLLTHDDTVHLTGRARAIMDAAVETVLVGGLPKDLARSLGFSPSTLLRWCERSQLPNPRRLILWMRVLFASALLDDPGHTVFSVGVACGYSGDQALRRAIRAVLPMTPSELREAGAFETASRAFFEELASLRDQNADKR
jgi:AraC-like DNA-binding protein